MATGTRQLLGQSSHTGSGGCDPGTYWVVDATPLGVLSGQLVVALHELPVVSQLPGVQLGLVQALNTPVGAGGHVEGGGSGGLVVTRLTTTQAWWEGQMQIAAAGAGDCRSTAAGADDWSKHVASQAAQAREFKCNCDQQAARLQSQPHFPVPLPAVSRLFCSASRHMAPFSSTCWL